MGSCDGYYNKLYPSPAHLKLVKVKLFISEKDGECYGFHGLFLILFYGKAPKIPHG